MKLCMDYVGPRPNWPRITKMPKYWIFNDFHKLWGATVIRPVVLWSWNFAQLLICTRTICKTNFTSIWCKMHVLYVRKDLREQNFAYLYHLWMTITFQPMLWMEWNFNYFSTSIRTIGSQKNTMIKEKIIMQ